jgi:hypothetical protein
MRLVGQHEPNRLLEQFAPRISHQVSLEPMLAFDVMAGRMNTKSDQIRAAWAAGNQIGALRIASRFFDRSTDTRTFKRGMNAHNHPGFYRQLGKDPQQLMRDALDVLAKRLKLAS